MSALEKETARIEAFSDGVFSIAITLLVLELHVPGINTVHNSADLLKGLQKDTYSYVSFIVSFFSIYIIWVNHHKLFKQIYKRNNAITFINGGLLFLVTAISFTTSLLSRFFDTGARYAAMAIYTGLFVLINISFNLLWYVAARNRDLLRHNLTDAAIICIRNNYLAGLPVQCIAFVLSFYYPVMALAISICLWIFWALTSGKVKHHLLKQES